MKRTAPFLIIIGVAGVTLFAVWYLTRSIGTPRSTLPPTSSAIRRAGSVKPGADPPRTLGSTDAPAMLEEFGDFECSTCAQVHLVMKEMKAKFGSRVVIVFREFPLESRHEHALAAARAAEAAGLQGKFWEMHDLLYEDQKTWHDAADVRPIFEAYATRIGLAIDQFQRDISDGIVDQRITLDRARGYSIGVNSTPTVFLNGREVPLESLQPEKLRDLIKTEIFTSSASPTL
jgi:protein-disulfide isomerase